MIDRTAILGMGGTLATFGLSHLDSLFGCIAGIITIVYMSRKLYQEVKKKWTMARYRTTGRLDDQVLQDGDRGFRGIDSYQEATSLEPGFVQTSENMRLIGDLAEVRKGIDFWQVV